MSGERKTVTLKIITNEVIVHSQLRSLNEILEREIDVRLTLNKRRSGSLVEFEVFEDEVPALKDKLGYTILRKNEAGWIPVI